MENYVLMKKGNSKNAAIMWWINGMTLAKKKNTKNSITGQGKEKRDEKGKEKEKERNGKYLG